MVKVISISFWWNIKRLCKTDLFLDSFGWENRRWFVLARKTECKFVDVVTFEKRNICIWLLTSSSTCEFIFCYFYKARWFQFNTIFCVVWLNLHMVVNYVWGSVVIINDICWWEVNGRNRNLYKCCNKLNWLIKFWQILFD